MSATATAVVYCGAVPVFADIEKDTYCLDPESVKTKISKNTKAILTVNLFGLPSSLFKLRKLADDNRIFLIEDNAQAPGALIKDKFTELLVILVSSALTDTKLCNVEKEV